MFMESLWEYLLHMTKTTETQWKISLINRVEGSGDKQKKKRDCQRHWKWQGMCRRIKLAREGDVKAVGGLRAWNYLK